MSMPSFSLEEKVAVITGASRGIGLAIARTFAGAGARVVLTSRRQEPLDKAAQEIRSSGGQAFAIAAHTGDPVAIQQLVARVLEEYGGIDILVNNAATNPHFGPILTSDDSHWEKTLEVNLLGYFRMIKACVDSMRQRGGGKIINIASIMGLQAAPHMGVYCVTKAGVLMMTRILALELAEANIQVNAIAPGMVQTRFSRSLWEDPELYQTLLKEIPQGRIAQPDEITGIALYLASPASSFTTGAIFVVDGGQLAGSQISQ